MFDPSSFANPTPLAHADTSRDVLPRGARFEMREKGGNRLVPGPDYVMDALKLPNQAPRVSSESLQTSVAWRCPDGTQHLFCWPILVNR
ncbi:hypothetical protein TNCV_3404511 [Trichonephila clavipes]|nr:hypothetical protein TNCV_3404511 [Trichonephila clavipes]